MVKTGNFAGVFFLFVRKCHLLHVVSSSSQQHCISVKRFSGYTAYPENQNPIYLTYQGRRAARFQTDDELEVLKVPPGDWTGLHENLRGDDYFFLGGVKR